MNKKEEAALLAQKRPQAKNSNNSISNAYEPVKQNELRDAMAEAKIAPKEAVATISSIFPSFDKTLLSKCMNPRKYGILLHPLGFAALLKLTKVEAQPSSEKGLTQCDCVIRHLKDYGSITSLEAMQEYGIMRLASRINDLKRLGYDINAVMESAKNRYGEPTSYARYYLQQDGSRDEKQV